MSETRDTPALSSSPRRVGEDAGARTEGAGADEIRDQISMTASTVAAGQVVVVVGGEVDMLTSPQLRSTVLEQFAPTSGVELVVLALDGITFLGTSGLAVLIEVREAAHGAGVELRIACTARRVLRPLMIAGLVPLFDIHDTVDAALVAT